VTGSAGARHVQRLQAAVQQMADVVEVTDRWGLILARVLGGGGRLLTAGNGGSAAQAQHLTAELVGRYREDRPPYSAICLSAETSSLTAIVNDYPSEELFARQVDAHGRRGDVLVVLSTSGRSPNVVTAAERGRRRGLQTWALTGPTPNPVADACDEVLVIDAPAPATVQELHLVAIHLVCEAFDAALTTSTYERDVVTPLRPVPLASTLTEDLG
jgi:D-sedoheptulose 7-phosphate isomerase